MGTERRNFISKITGYFLGILVPTTVSAKSSKKVKMLTADGKVVEVDAWVVEQSKSKKSPNKEILNWSNQILNKKSP